MENSNNQVSEKITELLKIALRYYGKEIELISAQHFSFDQINEEEKNNNGEYNYHIQYGFPQSGSVNIWFNYSEKNNSIIIDKVNVFAPADGKDFYIANFAPQYQTEEITMSINFGVDMDTQEHTSFEEIEKNPNAIKMLNVALRDLTKAEIVGDCNLDVPIGSKTLPCSNSTTRFRNKGKNI